MTLLTAVALWFALSVLATAFLARLMSGARRVEARVLAVPGVPADAVSLVALGIALPAPRRAEELVPA